ncbi:metallophosphoesterase [Chryseosolibacter indicus]|uniref:Metallophosphoesterase n=1 Tax=Chryseosolibacter indicus TaxID=2782351 RepID=A0ABS5VVW5_9BACT|nr:metallophosphoesterase [Chryseosolibacter indicus]
MKILAIGDIHGKKRWQEAVNNITVDQIVFLGDYINAK